jgi:hypothetical protein
MIPVRVRARHMADQAAVRSGLAPPEQRQVAHLRLVGAGSDQRGERVLVEQAGDRVLVIARERSRPVQAHRNAKV